MYKELLEEIRKAENICIFRHLRPDDDAVFSAFALKEFIKFNFKDKKVRCLGSEELDILPVTEKASDQFIRKSLAIILDCSVEERTDDTRFHLAKKIILIDHHPLKGPIPYGDIQIRDTEVAATCELLAKIFYSRAFLEYKMSPKCMEYLYCGILTDSNSFKTASTTDRTLYYASKLVKDGKLNSSDLNDYVFSKSVAYFNGISRIRNLLKIENGVGYVILNQKLLDKIGVSYNEAKNSIDEFGCINSLDKWAVFVYNRKTGHYDGSIRSRREFTINTLCYRYNGGGHKNACGVKMLTLRKVKEFIEELGKIEAC